MRTFGRADRWQTGMRGHSGHTADHGDQLSLPESPPVSPLQPTTSPAAIRTSAQTGNDDSALHITLSQVCAIEHSQNKTAEDDATPCKGEIQAVEDPGYVSREVSTGHTSSPGSNGGMRESRVEDSSSHAKNGEDDTVSAEIVMQVLNDSLDAEGPCKEGTGIGRDHYTEPDPSPDHLTEPDPSPDHSTSPTPCTVVGDQAAMADSKSTTTKPLPGTLLSLRTKYKRVSLRSAVHHRPPGGYSLSELNDLGVSAHVISVSGPKADNYYFPGHQFFSSSVVGGVPVCVGDGAQLTLKAGKAGVSEFWNAFRLSPGVDERLVGFRWFSNHYRQLVWKLAAMEVSYPRLFAGRWLTPDGLMLQMKYRYDREVDRAERSAVHKMCEHDDLPSRRLILCVSRVFHDRFVWSRAQDDCGTGNVNVTHRTEWTGKKDKGEPCVETGNLPCIELTDGWYSLPCVLDTPLKHMFGSGKLSIGTKLMIFGAELVGLDSPCHPLEVPQSCCLKISTNSTRRARWFAKLGYQTTPHPFSVPLTSLYPDGGLVGSTNVVIARVYPLVFLEKKEGAKNIFRSERQERNVSENFEKEKQTRIDGICIRVQKKFENEMAKKGKL